MTARSSRRPASSLAAAAAAAALLLLAAGASCVAAQAPAGCTLTLYLNASASSLSMAGSSVVQPIQQPLIPKFPDALVGFEGALSLVLPGGPCPTTAAGVEQRLAGASLQTTAATPPLLLYPAESIEVGALAGAGGASGAWPAGSMPAHVAAAEAAAPCRPRPPPPPHHTRSCRCSLRLPPPPAAAPGLHLCHAGPPRQRVQRQQRPAGGGARRRRRRLQHHPGGRDCQGLRAFHLPHHHRAAAHGRQHRLQRLLSHRRRAGAHAPAAAESSRCAASVRSR